MKNIRYGRICFIVIQFLLIVSSGINARTVIKETHATSVPVYDILEITLTVTSPAAGNPFTGTTVSAVFATPYGQKTVKGFCNSTTGSQYLVRFCPEKSGSYSYQITFQDALGSEQFNGSFTATASGAKKGFIIADPEYPTRFMFSNGGHPFICSKTAWLIGGIGESKYKAFLDKMVPRTENCIRFGLEFDYSTETPYIDIWPFGGSRSAPDYTRFNIDFWKNLDRVIRYAAARDIYLEPVIFSSLRTNLEWTHAKRYLDYIISRLACYPSIVLFQTNNEYNPDIDSKGYLIQVADYIHQNDPYGHLVAPARRSTEDAAWADEAWVDVAINHWARANDHGLNKIYTIATRITGYSMPGWCDETAREGRHTNNCGIHRRKQYWTWNIAGAYWSYHSWEGCEGILDTSYNGPGSEYLQYIRPFWEKTKFWKMRPNNALITNNPPSLYERCIASDEEIVVYMCNGPDDTNSLSEIPDAITNSATIRMQLGEGSYTAEFYNPSDGTYYTAYRQTGIEGNKAVTLTFPTFNQDLVLYIKRDQLVTPPVADFSAAPLSGYAPLTVQFTNLSTDAATYEWDFGDDTDHTTLNNPLHVYYTPGSYQVTLTATGTSGTDTEIKSNYIIVNAQPPAADFSATPLTGKAPLSVQFTNLSTDAASYDWNFGDGSAHVSATSPLHVYTTPGSYQVTLVATGDGGADTEIKSNYIQVNTLPDLSAPAALMASKSGTNNLTLSWEAVSGATGYNIYRATSADFTADKSGGSNRVAQNIQDGNVSLSGVQWTDTDNVTGNVNDNYFYQVTALRGAEESAVSAMIGEFDFALKTTARTDLNDIALPLMPASIATAADLPLLATAINSVARWAADVQNYEIYIPQSSISNFPLEAGYPYLVNVSANSILTVIGEPVYPVFPLLTTAKTDFNAIMLPLDKAGITKASQLAADIAYCNSVARWDAEEQGFEQYVPELAFTDFDTRAGYPYYVNVTGNSVWPVRGSLKTAVKIANQRAIVSSKAPHLVYGDLEDIAVSRFSAIIAGRPEDVLTQTSPGCRLDDKRLLVQTAGFKANWKPGETLVVKLYGQEGQLLAVVEQQLSDNACDYAGTSRIQQLPEHFSLQQNYPNPFNPETTIKFTVPVRAQVSIRVYNTSGQLIRTLTEEIKAAGEYRAVWDGRDDAGMPVASGAYIVAMQSDQYSKAIKAVLLK